MPEPNSPFAEVVRRFYEAEIRFIVIGGVALGAHGSSYLTKDTDFAYSIEPENLERLAAFLKTIHARVLGRPANDGFVVTPMTLERARFVNLRTDLGEVDVMREIAGVDSFEGLWERSVPMDFGGFTVRVASIDDLIVMKRAANRPKDQAHIYELLALKKLAAEKEAAEEEATEQEAESSRENLPDRE
jgi:predicted nucleotidyltransferase